MLELYHGRLVRAHAPAAVVRDGGRPVAHRSDRDRYAKFEPDPWPRVQELLRAA